MAGQNPYEPALTPVTTAETRVEGENQVADGQQPLDYTEVMRASNEGTPRRDVQAEQPRIDVSDIKTLGVKLN